MNIRRGLGGNEKTLDVYENLLQEHLAILFLPARKRKMKFPVRIEPVY